MGSAPALQAAPDLVAFLIAGATVLPALLVVGGGAGWLTLSGSAFLPFVLVGFRS